jgi:hypothetical protein
LRVNAHPVLVELDRTFEDIAHAQFLADLPCADVLALEGEGGIARDYEAIADARLPGCLRHRERDDARRGDGGATVEAPTMGTVSCW